MYLFWLIIVVVLAFVEATTVNLISIWFVISGLASVFSSFFTDSFLIQFGIFVLGGSLLLCLTRKGVKKLIDKKRIERTNLDRVIGMEAIVTKKISPFIPGVVKVDGKEWTAVSKEELDENVKAKVLAIDGVKLRVERSGDK